MAERPRAENLEAENSPEQTVADALTSAENREAADPVVSSEWAKEAKKYLKFSAGLHAGAIEGLLVGGIPGAVVGGAIGAVSPEMSLHVAPRLGIKIVYGLLKFAYLAIKNKGKVPGAFKIGMDMFDFDGKKDKK